MEFIVGGIGLGIVLAAAPVLMPSWRAFCTCFIVLGGPVILIWLHHFYEASQPNFKLGLGGFFGTFLFSIVTFALYAGFAIGAMIHAGRTPSDPRYDRYFEYDENEK